MPRTPPVVESLPLHSTDLLALFDSAEIIQYENPATERFYGYDQNDLVGERVVSDLHSEDRTRVMLAFEAVTTDKRHHPESVEYRHRTADDRRGMSEKTASHEPFDGDRDVDGSSAGTVLREATERTNEPFSVDEELA